MLIDFLKTVPQYLLPKQAITALAGLLAGVKSPTVKNFIIRQFIAKYQVNMQEALAEDPTTYASFNEFLYASSNLTAAPRLRQTLYPPWMAPSASWAGLKRANAAGQGALL